MLPPNQISKSTKKLMRIFCFFESNNESLLFPRFELIVSSQEVPCNEEFQFNIYAFGFYMLFSNSTWMPPSCQVTTPAPTTTRATPRYIEDYSLGATPSNFTGTEGEVEAGADTGTIEETEAGTEEENEEGTEAETVEEIEAGNKARNETGAEAENEPGNETGNEPGNEAGAEARVEAGDELVTIEETQAGTEAWNETCTEAGNQTWTEAGNQTTCMVDRTTPARLHWNIILHLLHVFFVDYMYRT